MKTNNQNGIAHIAGVLSVLVLAVVGFAGYKVYQSHSSAQLSFANNVSKIADSQKDASNTAVLAAATGGGGSSTPTKATYIAAAVKADAAATKSAAAAAGSAATAKTIADKAKASAKSAAAKAAAAQAEVFAHNAAGDKILAEGAKQATDSRLAAARVATTIAAAKIQANSAQVSANAAQSNANLAASAAVKAADSAAKAAAADKPPTPSPSPSPSPTPTPKPKPTPTPQVALTCQLTHAFSKNKLTLYLRVKNPSKTTSVGIRTATLTEKVTTRVGDKFQTVLSEKTSSQTFNFSHLVLPGKDMWPSKASYKLDNSFPSTKYDKVSRTYLVTATSQSPRYSCDFKHTSILTRHAASSGAGASRVQPE